MFHSFWSSRLTTAPWRSLALRWACRAWASNTAAPVLARKWVSMAAKPKLSALSCSKVEALLTTASTWPKCAITAGSRARTLASSPRSAKNGCALPARPVSASQSAAVCCASAAEWRWWTATFQPARARVSAISRPRRLPAPVTSAVRGAASGRGGGGEGHGRQSAGEYRTCERTVEFNERPAGAGARGHPRRRAAGCPLTASWPWPCTSRVWATTPTPRPNLAICPRARTGRAAIS